MLLWARYVPAKKPFPALFKHITPILRKLKTFPPGISLPFLRKKLLFMGRVPGGREGPPDAKYLLKRVKTVPDLFYYYCTGR
jgi:hypothetical protein